MKTEILQTSLDQFLKHGIKKMSVQKLVEPLEISTKTVYKHFKNKEDLLKEVLFFYYKEKYQSLENRVNEQNVVMLLCDIWYKSIEAELKVNEAFFRDLLQYYPELDKRYAATTDKIATKIFMRILHKGIDEGYLLEEMHSEVTLNGMFLLYASIVRQEHFKQFRLIPLDLLFNTMLMYVKGLCTEKGLEILNEHVKTLKPFHIEKHKEKAISC